MSKKLTFDFVKAAFQDRGYDLICTNYQHARAKLQYRCPKHPDKELFTTYETLKAGKGCHYCGGHMRLTYEQVKSRFDERGYVLLSESYVNNSTPLSYRCSKHPSENLHIALASLTAGRGCPICGRSMLIYDEVVELFANRGYQLLSTEYVNAYTKLVYRCPSHPDKMLRTNVEILQKGHGCRFCDIDKKSGANSSFWKGGITPEIRKIRTGWEYKKWRKTVFMQDNYTCQCCGIYGGKLVAHHLESFSCNEHLRFNAHNGVTLCKVCNNSDDPNSFHSVYGTHNNTRAQYEEWIRVRCDSVGVEGCSLLPLSYCTEYLAKHER